jgi:hypothetical protein
MGWKEWIDARDVPEEQLQLRHTQMRHALPIAAHFRTSHFISFHFTSIRHPKNDRTMRLSSPLL